MGAFSRLSVSKAAPFPGERAGKVTSIRIWSWGLEVCSTDLILVSPKHLTWEVPTAPRLQELKECLDNALRQIVGFFGLSHAGPGAGLHGSLLTQHTLILCFLQWMGMFSKCHTLTQIVSLSLKLFVNNREVLSLPCVTVPRRSCLIPRLFLLDL